MAMVRSAEALKVAGKAFGEQFGRDYSGLVESYRMDDADVAFVAMGSICGTIKDAIDEMRENGVKAGLVKIRCYRPFPAADIREALAGVGTVAVLEKNVSLGSAMKGAVGPEVKDAMDGTGTAVYSYVAGLGGRDLRKRDVAAMADLALKGEGNMFYGLREELI